MNSERVPVLKYRRIGRAAGRQERSHCVSPQSFAEQMAKLHKKGYQAVGIDGFMAWFRGEATLPEKAFLLTFDDGFFDLDRHVADLLQEFQWPAAIFLVTGLMGQTDEWMQSQGTSAVHRLLDWEQVEVLKTLGFTVHAHSRSHRDLTLLDDEQLASEVEGAKRDLAEHGFDARFFAYPYGRCDARVIAAVREAGYEAAFCNQCGFNRPQRDPFQIRRIQVHGSDSPVNLLRKIELGTNDGSRRARARYYQSRLQARIRPGSG
ncbi:MAG TPA: polysaccharide deacetylase family protein [Pseudomonadales bacterium]|nr:polysaccharide deacetylase family protein [Pseudomonadales bacterium]